MFIASFPPPLLIMNRTLRRSLSQLGVILEIFTQWSHPSLKNGHLVMFSPKEKDYHLADLLPQQYYVFGFDFRKRVTDSRSGILALYTVTYVTDHLDINIVIPKGKVNQLAEILPMRYEVPTLLETTEIIKTLNKEDPNQYSCNIASTNRCTRIYRFYI